jgi:hypothetical protein
VIAVKEGGWVKCRPVRRRAFVAQVLRLWPSGAVDVTDPKNGGTRTFAPELYRPVRRPKKEAT